MQSEPFNNVHGGGIYDQVFFREERDIRNVVPPPLNYYPPYYAGGGGIRNVVHPYYGGGGGQTHVYNMQHSCPPYLVPPNFIPIPWTLPYPHPSYNLYHHHCPSTTTTCYNFHHNPPFVHQLPGLGGVFNLVGGHQRPTPPAGYHDYTANSHYFNPPPPPPPPLTTSTSTYGDHHEKNPPSCSTSHANNDYGSDDDCRPDDDCGSDHDSYTSVRSETAMFHDYDSDFIDLSEHTQRAEVNYLDREMFERIRSRGQFDEQMIASPSKHEEEVGHDSNIYGKQQNYEVKADGYYRKGEAGGCGAILLDPTNGKPIVAVARTSKEAVSVLYHHLQGIEEGVQLALSRGCHEAQVFTSSEYAYRVVDGDITPMLKDQTLDVYEILC